MALVAIVTGFDPRLDVAITATGEYAAIETAIGLNLVAIITGFDTLLNMTITAAGDFAAIQTAIGLNLVPIITGFNASLYMTVTAGCGVAVVQTAVGLDLVGIVAILDTDSDNSIAAHRDAAVVSTTISVHLVPIITGFKALIDKAVPATRALASRQASVGIDIVCIVALLFVTAQDPITAARLDATVRAGVTIVSVAVIAGFAFIESTVATDLSLTLWIAAIADDVVTVIALLITLSTQFKVLTYDPITAARQTTPVAACVLIIRISIIAGFIADLLFTQISPNYPITASCDCTAAETAVVIDFVAVVALLRALYHAITATRRRAFMAIVGRIIIAVIAALTWSENTITAACQRAIR